MSSRPPQAYNATAFDMLQLPNTIMTVFEPAANDIGRPV
jgi:hypothetical protein